MRKIVSLLLLVMIVISASACSMNQNGTDDDHTTAQKTIERVLEAIETKNESALKSLFSKTVLSKAKTIDDSVEMLFDYFDGTVESYDDGAGPFVETTRAEENEYQFMESSIDVKTDVNEYRIAIQYVTKGDKNDIGLVSLYILQKSDDKNPDYTYWGDGSFSPGIHVAVPNDI